MQLGGKGMDKNKGSLTIKFSGKESLNLNVLSRLCSSLIAVLNKISIVSSNSKNEYSVSYANNDGFSMTIYQDTASENSMIDTDINVFNTLLDILAIRRFICRSGKFSVLVEDGSCSIDNTIETEWFEPSSYSIYSFDNTIEDNLTKLSSMISSCRNSFQAIYKNGILEKRVTYSKEDLQNTSSKIDLEAMLSTKEEYSSCMSLQVEQLDLLGSGSWKFKDATNVRGGSFKAKIKDKEFTKNLKAGNVIIGYGLILKGDVKTTIIKDKFGKVVPNKSTYIIEKVHDVVYSSQSDNTTLVLE